LDQGLGAFNFFFKGFGCSWVSSKDLDVVDFKDLDFGWVL
jgi:hypothetical protein